MARTVVTNRLVVRELTKSLQLNGTDEYASITDASQIGLDIATNDFMIGGWFNITDDDGLQVLFAKYSGAAFANNSGGLGYELLYRGDQDTRRLHFRVNNGSGGGATTQTDGTTYTDIAGNWNHIICVVDRTAGTGVIYVNGVNVILNDSDDISGQSGTYSNTGDFFVGLQSGTGSSTHMTGFINDMFMIDFGTGGLTEVQSTIDDIYFRTKFPSDLVSHWTFDNTAGDLTGKNSLTLTGSPSFSDERRSKVRASVLSRTATTGTRILV